MAGIPNQTRYLYIGTYTTDIYVYDFHTSAGAMQPVGKAPGSDNPSYLAIHPNGRYLYAVNEIGDYDHTSSGAVTAYAICPDTGHLSLINKRSSQGAGPCYVSLDATGKYALVANYSGGSVAVLPVQTDGSLGEATDCVQHRGFSINPKRQEAPHPHLIMVDPGNAWVFVPDLGLDRIVIYPFKEELGRLGPCPLRPVRSKPGAGPRHFAFHPHGAFAYVINELDSTITAYRYDGELGTLDEIETVGTLPRGFAGNSTTADLHIHPSGKFLYGSNRGHDSIAIYAVDESTGKLICLGHQDTLGKTPRNFAIAPNGRFMLVANQDSDNVVVFEIDLITGGLKPTGTVVDVPSPVCIKM